MKIFSSDWWLNYFGISLSFGGQHGKIEFVKDFDVVGSSNKLSSEDLAKINKLISRHEQQKENKTVDN